MSDLAERLTRDLREIADHATPAPGAWEHIRARLGDGSSDPDTHEMEVVMLSPNRQRPKARMWILVGVAAAVVLGITATVIALTRDDETPIATADTQAALDLANQFMAARDTWDGNAIRALVADNATINDFAVTTPDDYIANADLERAMQWRYMQPGCSVSAVGPPIQVRCTYEMQNALSQAVGVGPFTGSTFTLAIEDGKITQVDNAFDDSQPSSQSLAVFSTWLNDQHPGDEAKLFDTTPDGSSMRSTTPEAIALWQERIPEFEAVETAVRFMQARDKWDGTAVRALVADSAQIDDFAVAIPDDYLANADFERATQWRYMQPACTVTATRPESTVRCTYVMKNALSAAVGSGPYTGSSFTFTIVDGQITAITDDFNSSQYAPEVLDGVFLPWLEQHHPADEATMFNNTDGGLARSLTPASIALWQQRIPEFEAFIASGG